MNHTFCWQQFTSKNGEPMWNTLQKVKPVLDIIQLQLQSTWSIGKKCCIDELMIKYMGQSIGWVQYYMPAKPIKHGIKVFALCCSFTAGYLYSFEVYTSKDADTDGSPPAIITQLLQGAGFPIRNNSRSRVLYTDNFYTALVVMRTIYLLFEMFLFETYKLSKKKSRTATDFPFHRLLNPALKKISCGWMQTAVQTMYTKRGKPMYDVSNYVEIQKKGCLLAQYWCLSINWTYCLAMGEIWGHHKWIKIPSHKISTDYLLANMGGVDRDDCGQQADWTIPIRTNQYYMHIFFWAMDGLINAMFCIVCEVGEKWNKEERKKCTRIRDGRYKFQMDLLAHKLISLGINMDWADQSDKSMKPVCMHRQKYIPCDCGWCFFCKLGFTHGIDHWWKTQKLHWNETVQCSPECRNIKSNVHECCLCFMQEKEKNPRMLFWSIQNKCHKTWKGCPTCGVVICSEHWKIYNHDLHAGCWI